MSVLKLLLLPFAMLYDLITGIRNQLYDRGYKPSASFDLPVIGVGNLSVGGTGKTPMVEHLIRLLYNKVKVATLSRGYGRITKGFRVASDEESSKTVGDEPFQLYKKFNPDVVVTVCEDRAFAIPHIVDQYDETGVIIMDDAFQHRRVKPGLMILLTEFSTPFYDDHLLPYGRLREGPEGAERADVIVVTKCPDPIAHEDVMRITHGIQLYSKAPVFFTRIRYRDPQPFGKHLQEFSTNVVLISGIANHKVLENYVHQHFKLQKHFVYRDHYQYSIRDVMAWKSYIEKQPSPVVLLTTEKDKVRLEQPDFQSVLADLPLFYIPIELDFIGNGKDFDALIESFINRFQRDV